MIMKKQELSPLIRIHKKSSHERAKALYLAKSSKVNELSIALFNDYDPLNHRGGFMLISDMFVLFAELIQILALMQSLATRWAWPEGYLKATNFIFLFNLDVWSFTKINSGSFHAVRDYDMPSSIMPFSYANVVIAWSSVCIILFLLFIVSYVTINRIKKRRYLLHRAYLLRFCIILVQILTLPVGIALFRTLHVTDDYTVDVDNTIEAFSTDHLAVIVPLLIISTAFVVAFSLLLIHKTAQHTVSKSSERHEGYLLLKELEYRLRISETWIIGNFHIFASFRLTHRHHRAYVHVFKFITLIVFASLYKNTLSQGIVLSVFFACALLIVLVTRPYRVTCYNVIYSYSLLVLSSDSLFSCLLVSFDPNTIRSVWLVPPYATWILGLLNGSLTVAWITFALYVLVRHNTFRESRGSSLWPSLLSDTCCLTLETQKYIEAVINGRLLLERIRAVPAIVADARRLSVEIKVINSLCRDAEYIRDALQESLRDLLDDLIETYTYIAPRSLFSVSVKETIQETAEQFLQLVPDLVTRLHQREFDFLFVHPMKRRILFKLFCLATLMTGRKRVVIQKSMEHEALVKLWQPEG